MQTSQQPSAPVYGDGAAQPGTVIVQTVAPVVHRPQAPSRRPAQLPHAKLHMVFGIIQMVVGALCFVLDVIAVSLASQHPRFGAGIYSGIFFCVAGLLGNLAGRNNSTCCVIGCMVMNIIASCVAVISITEASSEITTITMDLHIGYIYAYGQFFRGKSAFVACACVFEFVFTIIHASLTCASCCYCCMPRTPVAEPPQVTATIVHGAPVQQQAYYPPQQGYIQHYPQQMQPQPAPTGYMPYPTHVAAPAYPQASTNPPVNPAFGPNSTFPEQPPPYGDVESKQISP